MKEVSVEEDIGAKLPYKVVRPDESRVECKEMMKEVQIEIQLEDF